jgi:hypothetical protein
MESSLPSQVVDILAKVDIKKCEKFLEKVFSEIEAKGLPLDSLKKGRVFEWMYAILDEGNPWRIIFMAEGPEDWSCSDLGVRSGRRG